MLTPKGLALEAAGDLVRLHWRPDAGYVDVTDRRAFSDAWARAAGDADFADFFEFVVDLRMFTCAQMIEAAERGERWPLEFGYVLDAGRLT